MAAYSEKSDTKLQVIPKIGHINVYEFKPDPFTGDYYEVTIISELAKGNFGTVHLGISKEFKDGKQIGREKRVAIKIIDITNYNDKERNDLNNEISILHKISNKDICKQYLLCLDYVGYAIEIFKKFIYIVSEYINGETLLDRLQKPRFGGDDAINAICSLLNAISILHKMDIAHRDIKLDNIMYSRDSSTFKLIDYGLACLNDVCSGWVGTPYSAAPEGFSRVIITDYKKLDIWSAGIILFIIIAKIYNKDEYFLQYVSFVEGIIKGLYDPRHLEGELSKHLTNITNEVNNELVKRIVPIIKNMVKTNPKERYSINDVINEIKDICADY